MMKFSHEGIDMKQLNFSRKTLFFLEGFVELIENYLFNCDGNNMFLSPGIEIVLLCMWRW